MECEGSISSVKYASIMLEDFLAIFLNGGMIKNESLFMEDGAPCHTAKTHKIDCSKMGLKDFCVLVSHQI